MNEQESQLLAFVDQLPNVREDRESFNEPPNPFAKFLQDAELAGRIGWAEAEAFGKQAASIGPSLDEIRKAQQHRAQIEWEQDVTASLARVASEVPDAGGKLEKRFKKAAARIEKMPNGGELHYDENGELIRALAPQA